jgi:hypothetical protein
VREVEARAWHGLGARGSWLRTCGLRPMTFAAYDLRLTACSLWLRG